MDDVEPALRFCAAHPATAVEDRADRAKMKDLKRRIEQNGQGAVLHVEDAVMCRDRWRVPVSFDVDAVRLEFAHFAAVRAMGANFVVEEEYSDAQMNAFFVEFPRARLSGWRAMSWPHRALCIVAASAFCASTYGVLLHVLPFFEL